MIGTWAGRIGLHHPLRLALVGAGVAVVAAGIIVAGKLHTVQPPPPAIAPGAAPTPEAGPLPSKPVFDIVRVGPQGGAVIAGRASPGSEIAIREGDTEIGRTRADSKGDWVFTSDKPLAPGPRTLTLSERGTDGHETKGDGTVFLVVPAKPPTQEANQEVKPPQPALAVLSEPNVPPRVLQPTNPAAPTQLGLAAVEYDETGGLRFTGSAHPGATVRVYIDSHAVGDARADTTGRWTLSPLSEAAPGQHRLRLDELRGTGPVARIELPFTRESPQTAAMAEGSVVVQPGQNLWQMARRAYGAGIRYTVIYSANREQIRDPNLIYPGQLFAMPTEGGTPVTPASSNRSR